MCGVGVVERSGGNGGVGVVQGWCKGVKIPTSEFLLRPREGQGVRVDTVNGKFNGISTFQCCFHLILRCFGGVVESPSWQAQEWDRNTGAVDQVA